MPAVHVAERIDAPADVVWDHISWHGVARLSGVFKSIEFFGDEPRVGVTKRLHLAEGLPVVERLEEIDEAERTYRYRVIDGGSLPVTDYRGYVRVTPCGPDACHLLIECRYVPVTVTSEEWAETWTALESGIIDAVRAAIGLERRLQP